MANIPQVSTFFDRTFRNTVNSVIDTLNTIDGRVTSAQTDASDAKTTSQQALAKSEQTETELSQAILAGDSSPLGGQLSVGSDGTVYGSPQERLIEEHDAVASQLAENGTELRVTQNNPTNYNGAIVTFIDDDGHPDAFEIWRTIIQEKGIKMGFAIVTGRVDNAKDPVYVDAGMTLDQVKQLQSEGHDIYSHTVNHYASYNVDINLLDDEYNISQQWLKNNGFDMYDVLVYPGGLASSEVPKKNIARKYYKYAISTNVDGIDSIGYTTSPVDNWCVQRIQGDTSTLTQLQTFVDNAIANNGWIIFMNHAFELNKDKINQMDKIRAIIDYCNTKNVPIMPFSEAVKLKGNAVAIGEYTNLENKFFVANDGKTTIKSQYQHKTGVTVMDKPLTEYESGTTTIQTVTYTNDSFLGQGGVLITYRTLNDAYAYQEFVPINTTDKYTRKWDDTNKVWKTFSKLNTNLIHVKYSDVATDTAIMDKPITSYHINSVTYVPIPYTRDTYKSLGGTMMVYRGESTRDDYAFAEYVSMGSPFTKHIRRWDTAVGSWKAWSQI